MTAATTVAPDAVRLAPDEEEPIRMPVAYDEDEDDDWDDEDDDWDDDDDDDWDEDDDWDDEEDWDEEEEWEEEFEDEDDVERPSRARDWD